MQAIVDGILNVPVQPARKTWNKTKNGEKVAGDHKKTDGTTKKPETLAEIGGKINMSIKNFNAKNSRYGPGGYKTELFRYLNEMKEMGGQPTAGQHEKLRVLADANEDLRNLMHIFAEGPQEDPPPLDQDEPMPRPEGTPRRPSPDIEDQQPAPPKRPALEPRVLNAPAQPTQIQAPTAAPAMTTAAGAATAGPSGGADPAGNNAPWSCKSFAPQYQEGPDGLTVTFGGSRLQYTWALDMRTHNVEDIGDFVPMGHTVPWHWIPFYCTPAEWESLPWKSHEMEITRVGVSITPIGKEVQFATASGSSTIASNEHLAIGFKSVGLNYAPGLPSTGMRRIKNNEDTSKLITKTSEQISYVDLRKRYWGPLSDWTAATELDSYKDDAQVSTAELSIRENEIVSGVFIQAYDKTTKANNKACFGSVLKDRYIERFPLVPQMGIPIIQEVYSPKCGFINTQPHRLLIQNKKECPRWGPGNSALQIICYDPQTKNNKLTGVGDGYNQFSRNTNIGLKELNKIGSYHGNIEKFRLINMGGDRQAAQTDGSVQPMITFGIQPIRLINIAASKPEYVNARVVWKIDYFLEIKCKFMKPDHCYATNVSADGTVYPPNMYTSALPRHLLNAPQWGTATGKTDSPDTEDHSVYTMHCQKDGRGENTVYVDTAETVAALMGAGTTAGCWNASDTGVVGI
jgi:hypothetical protein